MRPEDCIRFDFCGAPLCPLDNQITERVWYVSEEVCLSRKHAKKRWIKRQKRINNKQYDSWKDRPITYQELYDISRPRPLSDKQKAVLERLKQYGFKRKRDEH